ncbi:tetratricopeptide repeat protein [Brevibacillus humidisoli]|uniref:tetratricopeptide repeat protein n=1 Tax=Brevibacillus humidisoli TaxID=2895522 RepID=UPI001E41D9E9|nr:tetratricopeptide repeat protein [Brevibacillus humidisoli]UFJ41116.1 tetratricopeptide repeat protein [Brevibacillus humidisoli]
MSDLQKAITLRKEGQLEEAKRLLLDLYAREPENPSVLYQCAWIHDALGLEREAVPFYEKAIQMGLQSKERRGALLGLGSTYRALGQYDMAKAVFEQGLAEMPDAHEFSVFYAMVLHNVGEYEGAMQTLLKKIVEVTDDPGIAGYKKAILFYADRLQETWD